MATTQDFVNWVCGPRIIPDYLLWTFRAMKPEFERLMMGSTHQTIYMPDARQFKVLLPPLSVQQRISRFLDVRTEKIDALIEKKRKLVELLAEKRAALINQAVTKGLDPTVPMKDSGIPWIGEIPAHWRLSRLGFLAKVGNGSTPDRSKSQYWSDGQIPWLTSSKVNDGVISEADEFVTEDAVRDCHLPFVPAGSIVVAITGEGQTRGRAALLTIDTTVSQHLAFVKVVSAGLRPAFLWHLLNAYYSWLRWESSGGGSTKAAITCAMLRDVPIPLPPPNEQDAISKRIAAHLDRLERLVQLHERLLERLQEYRQALITAAVTGQLDIPDLEDSDG